MTNKVTFVYLVYLLFSMCINADWSYNYSPCECINLSGKVSCSVLKNEIASGCSRTQIKKNQPIKPFVIVYSISHNYVERLHGIYQYYITLKLHLNLKGMSSILSWELKWDNQNSISMKDKDHCGKVQINSSVSQSKDQEVGIGLSNNCLGSLKSIVSNSEPSKSHTYELILFNEREEVVHYQLNIPIGGSILNQSCWSASIAISKEPFENGSMYLIYSKAPWSFGILVYNVKISADGAIIKEITNTNESMITFPTGPYLWCTVNISAVNCTCCSDSVVAVYCRSVKKDPVSTWLIIITVVVVVVISIVIIAAFIAYKCVGPRIIERIKPSVLVIVSYDCKEHVETVNNFIAFLECFCTVESEKQKPRGMLLSYWIMDKMKTCDYFIVVGSKGALDKCINNVDRLEVEDHNRLMDPFKIIAPIIIKDLETAIHNNEKLNRFVGVRFIYNSSIEIPLLCDYKFLLPNDWKELIYHLLKLPPSSDKLLEDVEAMHCLDKLKQSIKATEEFMKKNPNWYHENSSRIKQTIIEVPLPPKKEDMLDRLSFFASSENMDQNSYCERLSQCGSCQEESDYCKMMSLSLDSLSSNEENIYFSE